MASKTIKGLTVEIGGDTTKLGKAVKDAESKSKSLARELSDINKLLKFDPSNTELLAQKQKVLAEAVESAKDKLETLKEAEKQVQKQFERGEVSEEQVRALQREIVQTQNHMEGYERAVRETAEQIKEFAQNTGEAGEESKKASKKIDDTTDSAKKASDGFSTAAVAVGTFIGNLALDVLREAVTLLKDMAMHLLEVGMDFEASMSNVAAISGAGEDLELLTATAREYGKTTVFSAAEAADALQYMALAGWKTQEMVAGLPGILNLAAASNMDLAEASDIVTDYLTAFGKSADYAETFADQMAYTMANANTNTEMLGEAYKNCAATAESLGYSIEETTAVIAVMSNAGIKGGEAGTALNAIMTRLATDTKGCASALADYGVNVYDAEGNMQTLSSILEGVSDIWGTLTDQEQANLSKIIAGVHHYSALQTIMTGLSDETKEAGKSFTDYAEALKNCDDVAGIMAKTMTNNLRGDLKMLNSAYDEFGITLYDSANVPMREAVQIMTNEVLPALTQLVSGVEGSDRVLGESLGNLVSNVLTNLTNMLPAVTSTAATLITTFAASVAESAPSIIDTVTESVLTAADSIEQTVPAIIENFSQKTPELIRSIAEGISSTAEEVLPMLVDIVQVLCDSLLNSENLGLFLQAGFDILNALADALAEALPQLVETAVDIVMFICKEILSAENLVNLIRTAAEIVTVLVDAIIDNADELLTAVVEIFSTLCDTLLDPKFLGDLVAVAAELAAHLIAGLCKFTGDLYTFTTTLFEAITDALLGINWADLCWEIIVGLFEGLFNAIPPEAVAFADEMMDAGINAATSFADSLISWLQDLPYNLGTLLGTAMAEVSNWKTTMQEEAQRTGEEFISSISTFFSELPGKASTWLDDTLTKIKEWGPKAIESGRKAAEDMVDEITKKADELPNKLKKAGEDLVRGLIEGIQNMDTWLKEKLRTFSQGILDGFNKNFEIHSPSRKTEWTGEMLDKGLESGILKHMNDPISAMERTAAGILGATAVDPDEIAISASASPAIVQTAGETGLAERLDKILAAIERGQIVMIDGEQLVGATADRMNRRFGTMQAMETRGSA